MFKPQEGNQYLLNNYYASGCTRQVSSEYLSNFLVACNTLFTYLKQQRNVLKECQIISRIISENGHAARINSPNQMIPLLTRERLFRLASEFNEMSFSVPFYYLLYDEICSAQLCIFPFSDLESNSFLRSSGSLNKKRWLGIVSVGTGISLLFNRILFPELINE